MWGELQSIGLSGLLQIAVLACAFYYVFLFLHGTRGAQVLVGLAFAMAILIGLTQFFHLDALNWLLRQISVLLGAAIIVIFHPEIRRALAELGKQPAFEISEEKRGVVENLVAAVTFLSEHRVGALIAVERDIGTRTIQETGVNLDAALTPELLSSIFFPHTPLHDGGAIIRGPRMVAAGCLFPLSQNPQLSRQIGTRHRAAIGMSEETDAVVTVVSEETGTISVAYRGRLSRGLDEEKLRRFLSALLVREPRARTTLQRIRRHLDLTPEGIAKSEQMASKEDSRGV